MSYDPTSLSDMDREINLLKNRISQISESWCYESGSQAWMGECPVHHGDGCLRTPEGLLIMLRQYEKLCAYHQLQLIDVHDIPDPYDPVFGDDKVCKCGHPYNRHFDTYEEMRAVGCKYCQCSNFEERLLED